MVKLGYVRSDPTERPRAASGHFAATSFMEMHYMTRTSTKWPQVIKSALDAVVAKYGHKNGYTDDQIVQIQREGESILDRALASGGTKASVTALEKQMASTVGEEFTSVFGKAGDSANDLSDSDDAMYAGLLGLLSASSDFGDEDEDPNDGF